MGGDEKRQQMLHNLFGDDQSEEEEEVDSEHHLQREYISDEGEGEIEPEGEGEVDIEGQGEVEVETEGEQHDIDPDPDRGESEGERVQSSPERAQSSQERAQSSPEREISDRRGVDSEGKEVETDDDEEEYGQRVVTSRRREVVDSESEEHQYDNEEEEVDQSRGQRSPSDGKEQTNNSHSVPDELRDAFGDSEEDEAEEYATQNDLDPESHRSPGEEEGSYGKDIRPEDMVPDEDAQDESEEENYEQKVREKPVGPPLELEIPMIRPPAHPDKMNIIRVSNIMGIEPKPFDPKTYAEEDMFVTDESGAKKRLRLDSNIVRWRKVRNPDGTVSVESNARFVRWSDGSIQLLIGNEVLDISTQEVQHDQAHLFLRHGKGILQSQGRLLKKMKFMPSSLSSNSHRQLTALVESRHKKVYKVKNCITDIDPEREKEEKERAEGQSIRAQELLHRKREKVNRKYTQTVDRGRQLSPGFLEEALDEDDEDYYDSRRSASRNRFEEDLEVEAQAEKRIMNAKRSHVRKEIPQKSSLSRQSRRPVDFSDSEREASEYESDGYEEEASPPRKRAHQEHEDYEDDEEEPEAKETSEEEDEEPRRRGKESRSGTKRRGVESDEESPPKKAATHRRMAVVFDSDDE
ncbi:hypothetical protein C5167_022728 [Papaver somniferum]|uniref:Leo1-like protein n=1 Tax=Papaver somniferum TaxID=3469 RepID=A0A4Y7JLR6_PAPSO|nr:protein LEO1 homolog [Papaver somniferum]RZC60970.1 hypothetical protein C5167_022728 [Papaver somniferum]